MVPFEPRPVPEQFEGRQSHVHNPRVTLVRTSPDENAERGGIIAGKLDDATGPMALALSLEGVSMLDVERADFHDPAANVALFDAPRENLDDDVGLLDRVADVNSEAFAETLAEKRHDYMREAVHAPDG